jgi:DNA polymerase
MREDNLKLIQKEYEADPALSHMRSEYINYVPGRGSLQPKIMIIGEAPGKWENYHKSPFMGQSGTLLFKLMKRANFTTDNCFITNVVKYRPIDPNGDNRTPTRNEVNASLHYLMREWVIINKPEIIIVLGNIAKSIFDIKGNITNIVGRKIRISSDKIVIPMVHPSYLLQQPFKQEHHEKIWASLRPLSK